jgi:hypothetical protein
VNYLFGTDTLFDPEDFAKLCARLGLDLLVATIIIVWVYYRRYRNREMVFTFYVLNVITFSLCALLRKTPMDMGFALGLFGIFGILRYRTEAIRTRDLTYLFIVLGLAIVNAVANKKISLSELLLVNVAICTLVAVVELSGESRRCSSTPVKYDRLELLRPDRRDDLLTDLRDRTGLDVLRVDVNEIDMLRDSADITLHYRTPSATR